MPEPTFTVPVEIHLEWNSALRAPPVRLRAQPWVDAAGDHADDLARIAGETLADPHGVFVGPALDGNLVIVAARDVRSVTIVMREASRPSDAA